MKKCLSVWGAFKDVFSRKHFKCMSFFQKQIRKRIQYMQECNNAFFGTLCFLKPLGTHRVISRRFLINKDCMTIKGIKHLKVKEQNFHKSIKQISGFQVQLLCSFFRLLCICIPGLCRTIYRASFQEVLDEVVYITIIFYLEQERTDIKFTRFLEVRMKIPWKVILLQTVSYFWAPI